MTMTASDDGTITLQLQDSRDIQMHFEVESCESLLAVFDKYSQFKGQPLDSLQFTHNGNTVGPDDSPASLGMSEGNATIQASLTGQALTRERVVQSCTSGSSSAVDLLAENKELCGERLSWFDSDGQECSTPPIFICIDYGHISLVESLIPLYKGILNDVKDGDGDYSPLQWASWTGRLDMVKLLLEKGGATADEEALSLAREHDHNDVVEFLLKHVDLYTGLEGDADAIMETACREGDSKMVRKLLGEGYDIEKWKDADGKYLSFSPMYMALKHAHMDLLQLFAEKGMDLAEAVTEVSAE